MNYFRQHVREWLLRYLEPTYRPKCDDPGEGWNEVVDGVGAEPPLDVHHALRACPLYVKGHRPVRVVRRLRLTHCFLWVKGTVFDSKVWFQCDFIVIMMGFFCD